MPPAWRACPVLIEIPGTALLAHQVGDRLPVEIYVYAHDASGALRDYFTQTVQVDLGLHRDRLDARRPSLFRAARARRRATTGSARSCATARTAAWGCVAEDVRVPDFSGRAALHRAAPLSRQLLPGNLRSRQDGRGGQERRRSGDRCSRPRERTSFRRRFPRCAPGVRRTSRSWRTTSASRRTKR